MTAVTFVLPGKPVGKGRPRMTRTGHAYTPEKTRQAEVNIRHVATVAMAGRAPFDGPCEVTILVTLRPAESWSKKRKAAAMSHLTRPTGRPDLDNVLKAILDACNGVIFVDDSQVVLMMVEKWFGAVDKTEVRVETVSPAIGRLAITLADPPFAMPPEDAP